MLMLKDMMFEESVAQETYSNFEINRYHSTFKVLANVTQPAVDADIVLKLHADSVDSDNRFYPQRFDAVMFSNEVGGIIWNIDTTTPSEPELTIKIQKSGAQFPALTAGDEVTIISNAYSEGSGQPVSRIAGVIEDSNDLQIIKETFSVTGTEMTNQTWLNLKGIDGAPYYWVEGQAQMDYRMLLKVDGALTWGERTTNPSVIDPDTGNKIYTTEGCYRYARRKANPYPKASGALDMTDFDAIDLLLERNHVGNYVLTLSGSKRYQNIENMAVTYLQDTNINYATETANKDLFGGRTGKDLAVNFKYLTKSGRTFLLKRNSNSTNPSTFGAAGYSMAEQSLMVPLSRFVEPKTNKPSSCLGMRYKALGGYNRRTETYPVRGAGPGLKVSEFDVSNVYQRQNVGSHNTAGNQWVFISLP